MILAVVTFIMFYATPVWYIAFNVQRNRKKFNSLQRTMNLKILAAYRTVSTTVVGIPPIHLQARKRKRILEGMNKKNSDEMLNEEWQTEWETSSTSNWKKD